MVEMSGRNKMTFEPADYVVLVVILVTPFAMAVLAR